MTYYMSKRKHKLFYTSALQFIAYTAVEEIDESEKLQMLTEMAMACLFSKEIYNFSELLEQPMLLTLKDSKNAWIYHLLEIFNQGNIVEFEKFINQPQAQNAQITENKKTLEQKIRLMAFLELAFNLPKNDRVVPFDVLGRKCGIPV